MKNKIIITIITAFMLTACAAKSEPQTQRYEDYFPPIEEKKKTTVTPAVNQPSVCRAKQTEGPRKVGNPYKIDGLMYYPIESADGFSEEGVASWYGPGFHGKKTANGEVYNQRAMTAAHKTLPLPTLVRVRNVENGREIIVRVNDRGPFSKGRIIDLTEEGAKRIGMLDKGTARVKISVLSEDPNCYVASGKEVDLDSGNFAVQLAAFQNDENAARLVSKLGTKAMVQRGEINGAMWNRVWLTGYKSKSEALRAVDDYTYEFPGAFVIAR